MKFSRLRLLIQVIFAAATNGYLSGFVNGGIYKGATKGICVPGLNCYSCPGALFSCPIGGVQAFLASANTKFPFYVLGFMFAFGAVLGRTVCGFLCPFGLVQDLLFKIPFLKKLKTLPGERGLRVIKYGVLIAFVILLPLTVRDIAGVGAPWFCKLICPSGTLFAGIPLVSANEGMQQAAGGLFALKLSVLIFLLLLSLALWRPFCRYLCPLGAFYGLFNGIAPVRLRVDEKKCVKCKKCQAACGFDLPVYRTPSHKECVRCGKCITVCPTRAITIGAGKIRLPKNEIPANGKKRA